MSKSTTAKEGIDTQFDAEFTDAASLTDELKHWLMRVHGMREIDALARSQQIAQLLIKAALFTVFAGKLDDGPNDYERNYKVITEPLPWDAALAELKTCSDYHFYFMQVEGNLAHFMGQP